MAVYQIFARPGPLTLGLLVLGIGLMGSANPLFAQAAVAEAPAAAETEQQEAEIDAAMFNTLFEQVMANPLPPAAPVQPVAFNHQWHVAEVGLECTTCHTNPDPGLLMTFPDTETCMMCHADIATDKEPIQKLTAYDTAHEAVPLVRVYQVLPGVTWNHRTHIDAGVGCLNCHGPVPELVEMQQVTSVTAMASCMSCHQEQQVSNACTTCHSWPDDQLIRTGR